MPGAIPARHLVIEIADFHNKICQTLTLWRRLFHAKAHLSLIVYECPPFENE